jgi:O-methyltransferase
VGEERYLELLKRSLTGALQEEAVVPIEGRHRRHRPVVRLLQTRGLVLARRGHVEAAYIDEGRPVGPLVGESMIGRRRLDHLQWCVEDVLARGVLGDVIEAGVWKGGASILMRAVVSVHGSDRCVYLADSFQGLPSPTHPVDDPEIFKGFANLAVPREDVEAAFRRYGLLDDQVRFLEGWFADTLPTVADRTWAVIHIDADLYESTMDALTHLYPNLAPGGYVNIDDYGHLEPCRKAVDDYRTEHNITEALEFIDWTGVFWRRSDPHWTAPDASELSAAPHRHERTVQ